MIVSVAQAQVFFLALTRLLALLIHVPVLGGRMVPNMVKVALGLLLTMVMLPWQPLPPSAPAMEAFEMAVAIGREALLGTLAGFGAALTFGAIQMAGDLMGIGSGFGAGQLLNPSFEDSGSAMNQFFTLLATLLFLALDGHHAFLLAVQRTFEVAPLNQALPPLSSEHLLRLTGSLIAAGVQMALPVLAAVLLADLTLGLLARVAPQVHVFFLGAPLKVGVGLVALSLTLVALLPLLERLYAGLGEETLRLLGG